MVRAITRNILTSQFLSNNVGSDVPSKIRPLTQAGL